MDEMDEMDGMDEMDKYGLLVCGGDLSNGRLTQHNCEIQKPPLRDSNKNRILDPTVSLWAKQNNAPFGAKCQKNVQSKT